MADKATSAFATTIRFSDRKTHSAAKALAAQKNKTLSAWVVDLVENEIQKTWKSEMVDAYVPLDHILADNMRNKRKKR